MDAMAKQENSIESAHRTRLLECAWDDLTEAGAYVEMGSGDLYRFPKESLIQGGSPRVVPVDPGQQGSIPDDDEGSAHLRSAQCRAEFLTRAFPA
jgi:hypothetical protein